MREQTNLAILNNALSALKAAANRAGISPDDVLRLVEQKLYPPITHEFRIDGTITDSYVGVQTPTPTLMSDEELHETISMLAWESSDKDEDGRPSERLFRLLVAVGQQYVHQLMDEDNASDASPTKYVSSAISGLAENLELLVEEWDGRPVTVYAIGVSSMGSLSGGRTKVRLSTWTETKEEALAILASSAARYPAACYSYHELQVPFNKRYHAAIESALLDLQDPPNQAGPLRFIP